MAGHQRVGRDASKPGGLPLHAVPRPCRAPVTRYKNITKDFPDLPVDQRPLTLFRELSPTLHSELFADILRVVGRLYAVHIAPLVDVSREQT